MATGSSFYEHYSRFFMFEIAGFKVLETISQNHKFVVLRAIREADGKAVILKSPSGPSASQDDLNLLLNEFNVLNKNTSSYFERPIDFLHLGARKVIVFEDSGSLSLDRYMRKNEFSLSEKINIAMSITNALSDLIAAKLTHRDLKPQNILINPRDLKVRLTDFALAKTYSRGGSAFVNSDALVGTLAYMSPEQTGRMGRSVDYRSDFYSAGIVFYELFTGKLPFASSDTLELAYSHIAVEPEAPIKRTAGVPDAVSRIIMKLLAKSPDARYQTATGLYYDWHLCLKQVEEKDHFSSIHLATRDRASTIVIPDRLYGRDHELNILSSQLDFSKGKEAKLVLLRGSSGIGKSAIVKDLRRRLVRDRAIFVAGKCDQFQRNLSFFPFLQAFDSIIDYILQGTANSVSKWRSDILTALEGNGQILIDLIPRVELVIGKQPPLEQLLASEGFARTNFAIQAFLRVLTSNGKPIIFFLDDLQWADSATLSFIQRIVTEYELANIILIGAYRSEEVSALHPLEIMVEGVRKQGKTILDVPLHPLMADTLREILTDLIGLPESETRELAETLFHKTGGNPFFVFQFVKLLHEENVLTFNHSDLKWSYDRELIKKTSVTENVVDLLCTEINSLPENVIVCLQIASLLGTQFSQNHIAEIGTLNLPTVVEALRISADRSLIYPIDTNNLSAERTDGSAEPDLVWAFAHDRVREAANKIIPEAIAGQIHLKLATVLQQHAERNDSAASIFEIVNHFNQARHLLVSEKERVHLVQLNFKAGERARSSHAFTQSEGYLETAVSFLPKAPWTAVPELTFALKSQLAESKVLTGKFEEADELYNELEKHSPSKVELARLYASRSNLFYYSNLINESVECSLKGLEILGITFPRNKHLALAAMFSELIKSKKNLRRYSSHNLVDIAEMSDLEQKIAMEILIRFVVTAIIARPEILPVIALKMLNISLRYGLSPESGFGFAFYGTMQRILGDVESSKKFHKIALDVTERLGNLSLTVQVQATVMSFGGHFIDHFSTIEDRAKDVLQKAVQTGDLMYSVFGCFIALSSLIYRGEPLQEVMKAFEKYRSVFRNAKGTPLYAIVLGQFVMPTIMTATALDQTFVGKSHKDWDDFEKHLEEAKDIQSICIYSISRAEAEYLLGNHENAVRYSARSHKLLESLTTLPILPHHYYVYSLGLAKVIQGIDSQSKKHLKVFYKNLKKFGKWADECPSNFLAKYLILQAENSRISGDSLTALRLFEQAAREASKQGFIQVEALANELAGRMCDKLGLGKAAIVYLKQAEERYGIWQATHKQKLLSEEFPLIAVQNSRESTKDLVSQDKSGDTHTTNNKSNSLDFEAIIRSSHTLSGEIVLSKLVSQMMTLVMQISGARRAVLIKTEHGQMTVISEGTNDGEMIRGEDSFSASDSHELPQAILNFVSRSGESVLLGNAFESGDYKSDSYVIRARSKSILCLALMKQGRLSGILYLENDNSVGIFTSERENTLRLLSSQMAISVENALLYSKNEESRTRLQVLLDSTRKMASIHDQWGIVDVAARALAEQFGSSSQVDMDFYLNPDLKTNQVPGKEQSGLMAKVIVNGRPAPIKVEETKYRRAGDSNRPGKAAKILPVKWGSAELGWFEISGLPAGLDQGNFGFMDTLASSLGLGLKNIMLLDTERELNSNLEMKIREKTLDIRNILENIPQGIFAVESLEEQLIISNDYSTLCCDIADSKDIAEKDPFSTIFNRSNLSPEQLTDIRSALLSAIGAHSFQWAINSHILPNRANFLIHGMDRMCEIDFSPIVNVDRDEIVKIIVAIKDVTEIRNLEALRDRKEKEVEKLIELAAIRDKDYSIIMKSMRGYIDESIALQNESPDYIADLAQTIFRNVHTIKGLARTYGLNNMSKAAHEVEHLYQDVREKPSKYDSKRAKAYLQELKQELDEYESIALDRLGRGFEINKAVIDVSRLKKWVANAHALQGSLNSNEEFIAIDQLIG
ncbi:MAG: GAF domain-containing protein, partial [Proteobacteria bacterium]